MISAWPDNFVRAVEAITAYALQSPYIYIIGIILLIYLVNVFRRLIT